MRSPYLARGLTVLALLCLLGCGGGSGGGGGGGGGTFQFSFAVVADPHVGGQDAQDRLQDCVDWLNANEATYTIDLVLLAGDLGGGLTTVRTIMNGLNMPWVPVIGDNIIQGGREDDYHTVCEPVYTALAGTLTNWQKEPTPVANPDVGGNSYLQNFSFDHKGVHFMGIDWCTRVIGGATSESADLHAFPGGTWPWFQADIAACPKPRHENIVMLSHHPMHDVLGGLGALNTAELNTVMGFTAGYAEYVYANFAGHYHFDWHDGENAGGFEVFVTDATHDDENTLRLVRVLDDGVTFNYEHVLVEVPPTP